MTILVCGGRDYIDWRHIYDTLDAYRGRVTLLVHGAARGADTIAGAWAYENFTPVKVFPADWKKHGKAAGPIRNEEMLREVKPDLVVAFPGGRGTADMVDKAKAAGVEVFVVPPRRKRYLEGE